MKVIVFQENINLKEYYQFLLKTEIPNELLFLDQKEKLIAQMKSSIDDCAVLILEYKENNFYAEIFKLFSEYEKTIPIIYTHDKKVDISTLPGFGLDNNVSFFFQHSNPILLFNLIKRYLRKNQQENIFEYGFCQFSPYYFNVIKEDIPCNIYVGNSLDKTFSLLIKAGADASPILDKLKAINSNKEQFLYISSKNAQEFIAPLTSFIDD